MAEMLEAERGIKPLGEDEERLGGDSKGGAFLYSRGPHTYEVAHCLGGPSGVVRLNRNWVRYWMGPRQGQQVLEDERRDVLDRTMTLLQQQGWEVEIVED